MKNSITRLLALLMCAVMLGLTACASTDTQEPTETKTEIRVPEPVMYEKCTEMGTPLADVRVRRALALAIDVDTVTDALYSGSTEAWNIEGCDYDPKKAKELLAEAGWPSDYVLDVVYYQEDPQIADLLDVLAHYWEEVGVRAEIRKIEDGAAAALWTAPDDLEGDSAVKWDLAVCAVADMTELQHYGRFASDSVRNSHTPVVAGLDEAIGQGDTQTAKALLSERVSYIPLFYQEGFVCISDYLNTGNMVAGNGQYIYAKDILNWKTSREDCALYTDGAPEGDALCPAAYPGQLYQELVFERLLDVDSQLKPAGGRIAESYALADDAMTAEFILREELLWHDGEALTADDVKFTFELYLKCPDTDPVLTELLEKLEGAEEFVNGDAQDCAGITVEENKVTFRFAEKAEDALTVFSQWPVLPKHKLENVKPAKLQQNRFWKNPVGSGPFKVAELDPGKSCLLERWEDYWQSGEGNIDFVQMHPSADGPAVSAAREHLDYGWGLSTDDAEYIAQLDGMELLSVEQGCGVCIFINQYPHESYFALEENTEPNE